MGLSLMVSPPQRAGEGSETRQRLAGRWGQAGGVSIHPRVRTGQRAAFARGTPHPVPPSWRWMFASSPFLRSASSPGAQGVP